MKKTQWTFALLAVAAVLLPSLAHAQTETGNDLQSMHAVLQQIQGQMTQNTGRLQAVARGLAGFGAVFYIGFRVWKSLANAEPVDVFPLLKPFVLAWCIAFYGPVVKVIDNLIAPISDATHAMVTDSDAAIKELLAEKEAAIKGSKMWQMFVGDDGTGDMDAWYRYTHNNDDPPSTITSPWSALTSGIKFEMEKQAYKFQNQVKGWLSQVLNVLYEAASLAIDAIRTFYLIVLTLLGPLVFGFSCFDGFGHSLTNWLGRYIHVSLWLPVANIFGAIIGMIQQNMIKIDIEQIRQYGDTVFGPSDTAYLVFLVIAIVGYTTVPSVANYIVQATGSHAGVQKMTNLLVMASKSTVGGAHNVARGATHLSEGFRGSKEGAGLSGSAGSSVGYAGAYLADKLKGKPKPDGDKQT